MADLPILLFETEAEWEGWLEKNGAASQGIWMKIAKKNSGKVSISYAEGLDIALCFGWIDSQKRSFDEQYFLQKFTPRRANSPWSKINQEKVAKLIAQNRMREPGLKEVERAQANGQWDAAYDSQRNAAVPDDFQAALDQNPAAQAFFDQLNSVNRYAILYRIQRAKKPETRQKRIAEFITMLNEQRKIYD